MSAPPRPENPTTRRAGWHLTTLVVALLLAVIVPFLFWGDAFDAWLDLDGARTWMQGYGDLAWLAGIVLLVADIALPIPSTVVMSALGLVYGTLVGGLVAAAGAIASGVVAYGACRAFGRTAARWIAGEDGLQRGEVLFARRGGWIVALSRWLPVLPEAVACLAGLVRMPWRPFLLALVCGSLPLGFAFAAIGHLGRDEPGAALVLSAVVPGVLWGGALVWRRRRGA